MIDSLVTSNVLDGDESTLAEGFLDDESERRELLSESDTPLESLTSEADGVDTTPLSTLGEEDVQFIATYVTLQEYLTDVRPEEIIQLTPVLDQFRPESPASDGTPDPFLPLYGETVRSAVKLFSPALVYTWLHDCEPCDLVVEDLESIFEDDERDIALFSVYGPDNSELLHEEFDISQGPTILFVKNGRIDSRLVGAHYPSIVESEIEKILN